MNAMLAKLKNLYARMDDIAKMLFMFMSFIMAFVIVFLFILYITFSNILKSTHDDYMKRNIDSFITKINTTNMSVKNMALQMFFDKEVSGIFSGILSDAQKGKDLYDRLNYYRNLNPYTESIILYNSVRNKIYTSRSVTGYSLETANISEDLKELLKTETGNETVFLLRKNDVSGDKGRDIYTYIIYPYNNSDYAIVMNYYKNLFKIEMGSEDIFLAVDAKSNVLISSDSTWDGKNIQEKGFAAEIFQNGESGSFVTDFNGRKALLVYKRQNSLTFINVISYDVINAKMVTATVIIVIVLLLILLVMFLVLLFESKIIYAKIFGMHTQLKELQRHMHSTWRRRKWEFLRDLVQNSDSYSQRQLEKNLDSNDMQISMQKPYCLVLFKIDRFQSFYAEFSKNEQDAFFFGIVNIVDELFLENYDAEVIHMSDSEVLAIVNTDVVDEQLLQRVRRIQAAIADNMEYSFSAFISGVSEDALSISSLYTDVQGLLPYRLYEGHNCILAYGNYDLRNEFEQKLVASLEKQLVTDLQSGNFEQARAGLDSAFTEYQDLTPGNFRLCFIQLAISVKRLTEMIFYSSGESEDFLIYDILKDIEEAETIEEMKDTFYKLFDAIECVVSMSRNKKSSEFVEQVLEIIEANYADSGFCVESIAHQLSVSSKYATQLFKKHMFKTISAYIADYRMEKASQLLVNTNRMVTDIAKSVGYVSDSHFICNFKRKYGVTPMQYRKNTKYRK